MFFLFSSFNDEIFTYNSDRHSLSFTDQKCVPEFLVPLKIIRAKVLFEVVIDKALVHLLHIVNAHMKGHQRSSEFLITDGGRCLERVLEMSLDLNLRDGWMGSKFAYKFQWSFKLLVKQSNEIADDLRPVKC